MDASIPEITNVANRPDSDALFYMSSCASTFQIQCDTTYSGIPVSTISMDSLANCILSCLEDTCAAVTFVTASEDDKEGECTSYSVIVQRTTAEDSSKFSDSALLVIRSDGAFVAVPEDVTGSTVETIVDLSTTVTAGTVSDSTFLHAMATDNRPSPTMTTITKGDTQFASCIHPSTSSASTDVLVGYPWIPDGTPKNSNALSPGADSPQATFSTLFLYTQYLVQEVDICAADLIHCSLTTKTATETLRRTAISCLPGGCTGTGPVRTAAEICEVSF